MKKSTFKKEDVGKLVEVFFWDHASGHDGIKAVRCKVAGWLDDVRDLEIVVSSWVTDDDGLKLSENDDKYAILKSTIYAFKVRSVVR